MSKKEIRHQLALMEQDRIFIRNAHIRQKIYAGIFTAIVIGFWSWLMSYDCVYVWYGVLAVPATLLGMWLIITKRNYPWEMLVEEGEDE